MKQYKTDEEIEVIGEPWMIVRLRLKQHEAMVLEEADAIARPGIFLTRNRLYEAIHAWAKTLK